MRYTTFRFGLAPTPLQAGMLARHAGASRFAYNQCLQLVLDALEARRAGTQVSVPWSRFDLINRFNAWKNSQAAGRMFVAASDGSVTEQVTGLVWRHAVSAQVFEEAAVDRSRALAAYRDGKTSTRKGRQVGFPKRKRKGRCRDSFRLRNKRSKGGSAAIRVGEGHPRCVVLPRIGTLRRGRSWTGRVCRGRYGRRDGGRPVPLPKAALARHGKPATAIPSGCPDPARLT